MSKNTNELQELLNSLRKIEETVEGQEALSSLSWSRSPMEPDED